MTTRPNAAKVPNVTTRARYREKREIISDSDLNIGRFLDNAQNRNLRQVSKAFNQAFFKNLQCADAQELQDMRKEPEPCKNTTKVFYNPEKGIQRAIMCAIMSVKQDLHVYVETEHLDPFLASESVKCFDKNYALKLTLLYPKAQQDPPSKPTLYCRGGFRTLKGGWARNGRLSRDQEGVQVVRFTGNIHVADNGFFGHESLMELLDVNTIQEIHDDAFRQCFELQEVGDMPALETIGKRAFEFTPLEQLGDMSKLKTIGDRAFLRTPLVQLGDLSSLTTIGRAAFSDTRLEQLGYMPKLTTIGDSAFVGTPLTQLGDMPSLETIGDSAFVGTPLTQLGDMPSLTTIGGGAFLRTPLEQLGDMANLTTIGDHAFRGTRLTQLGDMSALTTIGRSAFGFSRLTQLGDMANLTGIGYGAFRFTRLTQLGYMPALTEIGIEAFEGTRLTQLGDMPSLKTIGESAFEGTPLTQLGNLGSLTTIGDGAFEDCTHLEVVHLPKTLESVGEDAFENCPLGDLTVQSGAKFKCNCANLVNGLRQLDGIVVTGGVPSYIIQTT